MPSLNGITTQEEELRGCHVTTLDGVFVPGDVPD